LRRIILEAQMNIPQAFQKRALKLLCALLFSASVGIVAHAQTGTSTVRGTISDQQGKKIAGATVTLVSTERSFTRTQTTGAEGEYTFSAIQPGTYRVEVEAQGFKKATINNVRALVDLPSDVDVTMEIGSVTEVVNVSSTGVDSLVNTQDASTGNNFNATQITQLPLESRNVPDLLSLQPGVTPDGSVAGSRSDQSNITLDGVDVNEQQTASNPQTGDPFYSVLRVTPDSTQEFRVTTLDANASQGRSSGAQVSLVTKSGTNEFHGSLYEFHRNTVTSANTYFNNAAGSYTASDLPVILGQAKAGDPKVPRPQLIRNLFGGALGGPIKKDRFFFFYNYEGLREASQRSVVEVVPTASLGAGTVRFPDASGKTTVISTSTFNTLFPALKENPAAVAFLANAAAKYPCNDNTVGDGGYNTCGYRFNARTPQNLNTNILRLDYNLKADGSQILSFRGNYQHDISVIDQAYPDTPPEQIYSHPLGFALSHSWTISQNKVNVFRYGLTREAFTQYGDATTDEIDFRSVFYPRLWARTLRRVTPVTNFTDDFTWIRGNHTFQMGGNVRLIKNQRLDFSRSYDNATTNYFFYANSGRSLTNPILNAGYTIGPGFSVNVRAAVAALLGRFAQYTENFNFDKSGNLLPSGTGIARTFSTQAYEGYFQDSWRARPNLTINLGLRYTYARPVYEANGYEAKPTISLSDFFARRVQGAYNGTPYNAPIVVDLAGIKNGKTSFYKPEKDDFQPRVSLVWSPSYKTGFLHKLFGNDGDSVIRTGFGVYYDYFGQALAVRYEANNTLGFSQGSTISANTYNASTKPGPLFTGLGQTIRGLPNIIVPTKLVFPTQKPLDGQRRIEASLDDNLQTPVNYAWNLTFGRKLPGGFYIEASYLGRVAHHLLASRDVATPNNLRDPKSGMDWYTAAGILEQLRVQQVDVSKVPTIPYFENLYKGISIGDLEFGDKTLSNTQAVYLMVANAGFGIGNDWTTVQDILDADTGLPYFYQPQYGALAAFSTIGNSNYHAGTLSIRQRFKEKLLLDFNYTFSKSIDDASGLQRGAVYTGGGLILNPFNQRLSRAVSDFDLTHIINFNSIYKLPIGKGERFFGNSSGILDTLIGGWSLTSIFRYNTGYPISAPYDAGHWATNWEIESNGVRLVPIQASPTKNGLGGLPNLFSNAQAAYNSFRSARPGEVGDRNVLRYPSYFRIDMGLYKTFTMPWNEKHKLQFRTEAFNVTNTQRFTGIQDFSIQTDPQFGTPQPGFGTFTDIQGGDKGRRVIQFGLRYTF
jgi:hypothetical protein